MSEPGGERRALLLINPKSRHGRESRELVRRLLTERGFQLIEPEAGSPGDFSDLVREHRWGVDLVIVGGGDGAIRCALDGIVHTGLPLGIVPLGTANNLARNLGIPADPVVACEVLSSGEPRSLDLGEVNGVYFFNVAGLGLSTQINRHVPAGTKKKYGVFAYAFYALKILRRTRPFRADITCDGEKTRVRTLQITICNGRHYGSGLTIAHDASIDDGKLDLTSIEALGWWQGIKLLPALWHGRSRGRSGLRHQRGREILIETRRPISIDIDGEVMTRTPARFRIHREAVAVLAPRLEKPAVERQAKERLVYEKPVFRESADGNLQS